jgi:hypothetical protein
MAENDLGIMNYGLFFRAAGKNPVEALAGGFWLLLGMLFQQIRVEEQIELNYIRFDCLDHPVIR